MVKDLFSPAVANQPDWAPNNTRILTPQVIERRTAAMFNVAQLMPKEIAAQFAQPLVGSSPMGLGFTFGDTFKRTQQSAQEFQLPFGQVDVIDRSLRFAFENVFIGKALRLKTNFSVKGLSNAGPNAQANDFFDEAHARLKLQRTYRQAMWLYYTAGLVPIIKSKKGEPLNYVEIVDPRMVVVERMFGKTAMFLRPDTRMLNAMRDPHGTNDPRNKVYYDAIPNRWKTQLNTLMRDMGGNKAILLKLDPDEFIVLENRYTPVEMRHASWDGAPLQHYFAAAERYRMLCAGDFAAAFLAKNLIALVSVGSPEHEKDHYQRPDDKALADLQAAFQNPNSAQWSYVDPTVNIRYITPDPAVFSSEKYKEVLEELKNILPAPFWYSDGNGAFASATVQLKELQEECDAANNDFDTNFWPEIHSSLIAAGGGQADRISKKDAKRAPTHDRNSLKDDGAYLTGMNNMYANGGLSVDTMMRANGIDPEVEKQKLKDQQADVKSGLYMPAFEQKQGIVADRTYGISKTPQAGAPGANGRPRKPGSKPQAESTHGRTPRPGGS